MTSAPPDMAASAALPPGRGQAGTGRERIQEALDTMVRDALRPTAWALAGLFGILSLSNSLLPPDAIVPMMVVAGVTAIAFAAAAALLSRSQPRPGTAHPLSAALSSLVLANIVIHLALLPGEERVIPLVMFLVGVGAFFLNTRWFLLVLGIAIAGFLLVAGYAFPAPVPWLSLGFWVFEAAVLSVIIHAARVRGMTRLVEAQVESEKRRRALEAANRELESFTAAASHDLKAPLRAIDVLSEALASDYGDRLDAEGRSYLTRIRVERERMALLIDDLLRLSRISREEARKEPVDLTALAESVAEELRQREPTRDVKIAVEPGLTAFGDPRLLRVVLENILGNAWKYTRKTPGPTVTVGEATREGVSAFFVRDNGAGFDPREGHRLFEPFQRLHPAREFEGTGIGLATVRRIIDRHGGRVWAESEGPGKGATFWFTL